MDNTGIELACVINGSEGWNMNWGISYSNPQKRTSVDAAGTVTQNDWQDYYGKLQLNGGVSYHKEKFGGALSVNYLGMRTRDTADAPKMRTQLFTNLNLSYAPTESRKFYLNVENLLDRRDITSSSTSTYYCLGRNFMFGYEAKL